MNFFDNETKQINRAPIKKNIIHQNLKENPSKKEESEKSKRVNNSDKNFSDNAIKKEPLKRVSISINKEDYKDLKDFVDQIRDHKENEGIKFSLDGTKISLNPIVKALVSNFVIRMDELDVRNMVFEEDVYKEVEKIFKKIKEH